ncbi:efflux RND transporter periplasmic adaptor subunit [Echinimonas agarilytica]|uniref:Efflux RND transporter periplasmic adaptor subunit n=1 Tax=Echinimonas agarilytica TaxID=1215918 RepID=A0AA41W6I1_9GAMM|nr:efflux RND transporter periplasmic adaptor subunit [Echinimonas agarilytica]
MKLYLFPLFFVLTLLFGCSDEAESSNEDVQTTPRVVQLTTVIPANSDHSYQFPATVQPVKTVELNFEVSGRLNFVDLKQGKMVKKGHLLATMDSTPFERKVRENKALHKQATLELERIKSLYGKKLAAKRDLDNAQTQFDITQIDLENSKQDLSYTKLVAPFDALISQRLLENDRYISAGTAVVRLQDVSRIRFELNVPERILSANISNKINSAKAIINGSINKTYDIEYIEHTTEPDPVTQTYKVLFEMQAPQDEHLTPGLRAYVEVNVTNLKHHGGVVVPINAVVAAADKSFYVWRFDETTHQVHQAPVDIAMASGNLVVIRSGIELGDQVVSAGVAQMSESMLVQPYVTE